MALFDTIGKTLIGLGISEAQKAIWRNNFQIDDVVGDAPVGTTISGVEVRDRLVIETTAIGESKDLAIDAYEIDITGGNNIVETQLVGRDGTFKERISNQDIKANITVTFISDEFNKYPEEDFRILYNALTVKGSIRLLCKVFDRVGAYDFVVNSHSMKAGIYTYQSVSFSVTQDRSEELDILSLATS